MGTDEPLPPRPSRPTDKTPVPDEVRETQSARSDEEPIDEEPIDEEPIDEELLDDELPFLESGYLAFADDEFGDDALADDAFVDADSEEAELGDDALEEDALDDDDELDDDDDGSPSPRTEAHPKGLVSLEEEERTAIVLKADLRRDSRREDPLAEIIALAKTAGIRVVQGLHQRLERPHPATYLGKGRVQEAANLAKQLDVDFILCDNDLSPGQERNLEKMIERTVIDRSTLIMDIFARRAQTHQAKLQVELAQLRYAAPRLKRMWTHLSRYEGGIGMRGPGETQLETDKRLLGTRIKRLLRQIARIEKRKESNLESRENEFVVALVGYTNAGKSTLLNALTGSDELVEDKLFATLDTRVRRWSLDETRHVLLTDTVGFIRKLPHHLVASFHATLTETRNADLLLHVVDASSRDAHWQIETVERVLREIECADKPTWLVLNKWDGVGPERLIDAHALRDRWSALRVLELDGLSSEDAASRRRSFEISAAKRTGLEKLAEAVAERLSSRDVLMEIEVPHQRGDIVSYVRESAQLEDSEYRDSGVYLRFRTTPARAARLRSVYRGAFRDASGGGATGGNESAGNESGGGGTAGEGEAPRDGDQR